MGNRTIYYCRLCKSGPYQSLHGFKIHLGKRHRTTAERALRRRFIKELRRAEQMGMVP